MPIERLTADDTRCGYAVPLIHKDASFAFLIPQDDLWYTGLDTRARRSDHQWGATQPALNHLRDLINTAELAGSPIVLPPGVRYGTTSPRAATTIDSVRGYFAVAWSRVFAIEECPDTCTVTVKVWPQRLDLVTHTRVVGAAAGQTGVVKCPDRRHNLVTYNVTRDHTRQDGQILTVITDPDALNCTETMCPVPVDAEAGSVVARV